MKRTRAACLGLAVVALSASALSGPAMAQDTLTAVQVVQLTQSALTVLGENPGPVDGRMGPATRAAVTTYVDASGLEMGWNGSAMDQGQAMSLNVAAKPALAALVGHDIDGNYLEVAVVPYAETEALLAGDLILAVAEFQRACATQPTGVTRIDGLMVFEPYGYTTVIAWEDGVFKALPSTGAWHEEAEPWRMVVLSENSFVLQQEGDNYVYARCRP